MYINAMSGNTVETIVDNWNLSAMLSLMVKIVPAPSNANAPIPQNNPVSKILIVS